MGKKKNKKKVPKRPHVLKLEYLKALADRLVKVNPSMNIMLNTLKDVYRTAYTEGYDRRQEDILYFKRKQQKHITDDWNKTKDEIDDLIHEKSNEKS